MVVLNVCIKMWGTIRTHARTHTHTPKNGSTKVLKIRAGMNALNGGLPQVSGWGEVLRWAGVRYSGGLDM